MLFPTKPLWEIPLFPFVCTQSKESNNYHKAFPFDRRKEFFSTVTAREEPQKVMTIE